MRLLVMRMGTAMTPQPHSNVGHGDEMMAMLKHLSKEHEVLAIGRFGVDPGVPYVQQRFTTSFPNENIEEMLAEFDSLLKAAVAFDPEGIVTVIGPSGSSSIPGGRARCQAFCANYCGPVVTIWNALPHLKRICILNDPRNILRLGELTVWPDAVLSQTNSSTPYRVFDTHMVRHYRYHKTQSWGLPEPVIGGERSGIGILAHSHIDDHRVGRRRDEVWDYVLQGCPGYTIRGRGWPDGPIPAGEVPGWLQRFEWGPMVPIAEGWVTAKFGQYARAGCIPRPYDAGGLLTYDSQGLMIPLDHPMRWRPGDNSYDTEWLHEAIAMTEPDFSSLDNVLSDIHRLPLYEVYGGYERV